MCFQQNLPGGAKCKNIPPQPPLLHQKMDGLNLSVWQSPAKVETATPELTQTENVGEEAVVAVVPEELL